MAYEAAWDALAEGGAEVVVLPSASPPTLRPMAEALRHHYYVVNRAPRDNASVFDPIGRTAAQITSPRVLVHEIDLAFAILHWSGTLQEGRALTARFGANVSYTYSTREDTGVFWSNDPQTRIGAMIRELGLRGMSGTIARVEAARRNRFRIASDCSRRRARSSPLSGADPPMVLPCPARRLAELTRKGHPISPRLRGTSRPVPASPRVPPAAPPRMTRA